MREQIKATFIEDGGDGADWAVKSIEALIAQAVQEVLLTAAPDGDQDDGYVGFYVLPTGPVHKAIAKYGVETGGKAKNISQYQKHLTQAREQTAGEILERYNGPFYQNDEPFGDWLIGYYQKLKEAK